jgi:hypothetical protein
MEKINASITVHLAHARQAVTIPGLLCQGPEGNQVLIPGDTVICAVGQWVRSHTDPTTPRANRRRTIM